MMEKSLSFQFQQKQKQRVSILIGDGTRKQVKEQVERCMPDAIFLICDEQVVDRYAPEIVCLLRPIAPVHLLTHVSDEKHKHLQTIDALITDMMSKHITSSSIIGGLGGGITGNLAGFAASVMYRGIPFFHLPTTLLAQVDSAPDVKHGINAGNRKNSVGTYKAPEFVICDPFFLRTLSDRELRSGLGESMKHAFAQDRVFLDRLRALFDQGRVPMTEELEAVIVRTIELKIAHWQSVPTMWNDPTKVERLTHLGHTVGKIIEMIDMDYFTHGEAISYGFVIELCVSAVCGYASLDRAKEAFALLHRVQLLPPFSPAYTFESLVEGLYPTEQSEPLFALLEDFGNPITHSQSVPRLLFEQGLRLYYNEMLGVEL